MNITDIPCRFGCDGPTTLFWFPRGCVCYPDQVQALCKQHEITAEPLESMSSIEVRAEKGET